MLADVNDIQHGDRGCCRPPHGPDEISIDTGSIMSASTQPPASSTEPCEQLKGRI
jgi:hypothetical protein